MKVPSIFQRVKQGDKNLPSIQEMDAMPKVNLEKGDIPAILISGFFNFVMPIMLICTALCLLAYFALIH